MSRSVNFSTPQATKRSSRATTSRSQAEITTSRSLVLTAIQMLLVKTRCLQCEPRQHLMMPGRRHLKLSLTQNPLVSL